MDIEILLFLQNIREALGPLFSRIAAYASDGITAVAIVIPFVTYWCLNKRRGQVMLAVLAGSLMLNQILKLAAAVYRPWVRDARINPPSFARRSATGYSFPSTHTQIAATAYGDLAIENRTSHPGRAVIYFALIILAGVLRMFLGVHTPQDILVGMLSALLMIPVCYFVFEKISKHDEQEFVFAAVFVFAAAAAITFALTKNYPMDYVDGQLLVDPQEMIKDFMLSAGLSVSMIIGGIIEHRTIRFSTECTIQRKVIRVISGLAMIALIYLITKLSASFIPVLANALIRGMLMGFYAVLVHPFLFTKAEEKWNSVPEKE